MTNGKSMLKEFHKFLKNVDKMSDGQVKIADWDDCNIASFELEVQPNGGPYQGGTFHFKVNLGEEFPVTPPTVFCTTQIYHPNIDPTEGSESETNICLNMFEESEWTDAYGMDGIVQGLLFLFYEPNVEDPLSPYFDGTMQWEDFEENVKCSLKGEEVEGVQYEWNYGEKEEDKDADNDAKNDNSQEDVPKGDNSPKTDNEVNDDENTCNTDNKDLCESSVVSEDIPDPQKLSKKDTHDLVAEQPDLIQTAYENADCTTPDVVRCLQRTESVTCDAKTMQNKLSPIHDNQRCAPDVSLRCYDSLLPEMNLVFAVLSNVARAIKR